MEPSRFSAAVIFALVLVLGVVDAQSLGERCYTPNNRPGVCASIRECPELLAVLNSPKPDLNILHEASCGFAGRNPIVCCANRQGPANPPVANPGGVPPAANPGGVSTIQDVSNHANVRLLPMEICGPVAEPRIFGGNETGVLEYPWMALIGYNVRGKEEFHCGGSLINDRYVLTAAHCVTSLPSSYILSSVRLGEHDLNEAIDCDKDTKVCALPPLNFDIEQALPHRQYSKGRMKNDIALIRLRGRIDFRNTAVRPICLPVGITHQNRYLDNQTMIVAGWGVTEKEVTSTVQLKVNVPVVPAPRCKMIYEKSTQIEPSQLCAGGEKGRDSCNGDSGGPLFFLGLVGEEQKTVQYGIVSFGPRNCGTEGTPGVYTRVGYFMDWVLNNMAS